MRLNIQHQTARGLETPSLREANENTNSSFGTNYDYVLRGEVQGWPTRDFQLDESLLEELRNDVEQLQNATEQH